MVTSVPAGPLGGLKPSGWGGTTRTVKSTGFEQELLPSGQILLSSLCRPLSGMATQSGRFSSS
jgi:hypothetical protein